MTQEKSKFQKEIEEQQDKLEELYTKKKSPENFDNGLTRVAPKGEFKPSEKRLIKNVELASKVVLKEDEKLFKELSKEKPFVLKDKMAIGGVVNFFWETDVKEFLRRLKEDCSTFISAGAICSVINKLSGFEE